MASFDSIQEAQTFYKCQFCEESSEIKWRCVNCDLFLCQLCNFKIHNKCRSSLKHQIINISDCGTEGTVEIIRNVDLKNMNCDEHDGQMSVVYCDSCELPACSICVVLSHRNHAFSEIGNVYKTKLTEIKGLKDEIQIAIQCWQNEEDLVSDSLSKGEKAFIDNKANILQQEQDLTMAIKEYTQTLIDDLDSEWLPEKTTINTKFTSAKQCKDELTERSERLCQTLQSHHASDILTTGNSLNTTVSIPDNTVVPEGKKFVAKKIDNKNMYKIFGYLCPTASVEFQLVQTYDAPSGAFFKITSCDVNSALIPSYQNKDRKLLKVKFVNCHIKTEKEMKIENINDMAKRQNDDILLSTGTTDLKLLCMDGEIKTFQSFSPFTTSGVHVNKKNEIVLGLYKKNIKEHLGRVVVLNPDGTLQNTYDYDSDYKPMFTKPFRITSTKSGDICVVDRLNLNPGCAGRVVKLNQEVQWIYNGYKNSGNGIFKPTDIAVTCSDMIIISDSDNHSIHVLNQDGKVIVCWDLEDIGIVFPFSLDIDEAEMLWIACGRLNHNSKIHAFKLL